jgi:hypothetical protein
MIDVGGRACSRQLSLRIRSEGQNAAQDLGESRQTYGDEASANDLAVGPTARDVPEQEERRRDDGRKFKLEGASATSFAMLAGKSELHNTARKLAHIVVYNGSEICTRRPS